MYVCVFVCVCVCVCACVCLCMYVCVCVFVLCSEYPGPMSLNPLNGGKNRVHTTGEMRFVL